MRQLTLQPKHFVNARQENAAGTQILYIFTVRIAQNIFRTVTDGNDVLTPSVTFLITKTGLNKNKRKFNALAHNTEGTLREKQILAQK